MSLFPFHDNVARGVRFPNWSPRNLREQMHTRDHSRLAHWRLVRRGSAAAAAPEARA
jgi:hypothetical protein